MEIFEGYRALGRPLVAPAVTIGNFDGVHLGHRALLARADAAARRLGGDAVALTFEPHPAVILAPDRAPPRLTTRARKLELLRARGVDVVIVEPFTRELAALSADDFVRAILVDVLGARHVVVGYDFHYGARRGGTTETLAASGRRHGFEVEVVAPVTVGTEAPSSSAIRRLVAAGEVRHAAELLGRPHDVDGVVVRGAGRGRGIGVPTANLEVEGALLPAPGIYAVWASLPGGERVMGAASLGTNPTFGAGAPLTLEVHLLDWDGDLYGQPLRTSFVHRLRGEERYDSVEALVAQIRRDVDQTRAILTAEDTPA